MKSKIFIMLFLLMLSLVSYAQEKIDLQLPEWQLEDELLFYNAENLWEYINGAADQFLSYDFRNLQSGDYKSGELGITIDIYNMDTPLNAFGIYNIEKPKDKKTLKIGTETVIVPPYQILQLKDKYYIKCNIYEGQYNEKAIKQLMENIAGSLKGTSKSPAEFSNLPKDNRVNGTECYIKKGFQGLSDLKNCISADYNVENAKFQYFYIFMEKDSQFEETWQLFSAKWKPLEIDGKGILYKKIPYKGYIGLCQANKKIYGITNCSNKEILEQRFKELLKEVI